MLSTCVSQFGASSSRLFALLAERHALWQVPAMPQIFGTRCPILQASMLGSIETARKATGVSAKIYERSTQGGIHGAVADAESSTVEAGRGRGKDIQQVQRELRRSD